PLPLRRARWRGSPPRASCLRGRWLRSRCSPLSRAETRVPPRLAADLAVQEERDDEAEDDQGFRDDEVDQDLTEGFGALGQGARAGGADGRLSDTYGDGREADGQAGPDGDEAGSEAGAAGFLSQGDAAEDGEGGEGYQDTRDLLHHLPPTNLNGVYGRPLSS